MTTIVQSFKVGEVSQQSKLLGILLPLLFISSPFILTSQARESAGMAQASAQLPDQTSEIDGLVQNAYESYQQGRFDEALAKCTKAVAINPKDFRPHAIAGLAFMAQWKMKSASEQFATVIRLQPERKEFYVLKAKADIRLGAIDEAVTGCRRALELDPKFADAHITIGEALETDKKRQTEAISAYRSALNINPNLFSVYESLGQIFVSMKDEKRAEEIFRQGMTADPNHMSGRFRLGRLLVKQGRLVEARQLWEARTSDEDRTMPTFIQILTRAENLKRATDALDQNPEDPDALNNMGLAVMDGAHWVVDGRQERAIIYFIKALKFRPQFAQAQYNIVKAMIQYMDDLGKDKKKVDQELARLRQLDPSLAAELEEYRKTHKSGLISTPIDLKR